MLGFGMCCCNVETLCADCDAGTPADDIEVDLGSLSWLGIGDCSTPCGNIGGVYTLTRNTTGNLCEWKYEEALCTGFTFKIRANVLIFASTRSWFARVEYTNGTGGGIGEYSAGHNTFPDDQAGCDASFSMSISSSGSPAEANMACYTDAGPPKSFVPPSSITLDPTP